MLRNSATYHVAESIEFVPTDYFCPLILDDIFVRAAPVEVDLGCGDGAYLTALAEQKPDRNFLGIERLLGRVRSACQKINHADLTNARILRVEIGYAVMHLFPTESVESFHLMFPDPWPKRRHSGRRVFTEEFLASIHNALTARGTLRIATDRTDYFREIEDLAAGASNFTVMADREEPPAVSTFEKRFKQNEIDIHRLLLKKTSPET
jgi:tRNA (guanine-N7-)-methyltransferase